MSVYRDGEDRLGAEERDAEACRVLGRWRDRVRNRILILGAVIGVGLFFAVVYGATQVQFRLNSNVASLRISVLFGSAFFVGTMLIARLIGQLVVRARMDAKVDELAKLYEIPRAPLAATADLLRGL